MEREGAYLRRSASTVRAASAGAGSALRESVKAWRAWRR